jgi:transposase, IS30 family
MGTHYSHLSEADRLSIESLLRLGHGCRSIATTLGFSPSTISREIRRGSGQPFGYEARVGQFVARRRRRSASRQRRKLGTNLRSPRWRAVLAGLRRGWSPQQIAGRLRFMLSEHERRASLSVSHETIYCAIYAMPRGTLRTELVKLLRKSHSGRLPRARGTSRFTSVQDMTPIQLRPPEVAARTVPGHWEGDLIKGAGNRSSVGTLVERTSRYLMLVQLDSGSSSNVLDGFTRRLKTIPPSLRKTLTYDQGSEMALHDTLADRLHIDIFFCDPHSPWQRGSNENANGLIREYLPKGMDLSGLTQRDLSIIESALNHRPRKILSFRTPHEVFTELRIGDIAGVALQA